MPRKRTRPYTAGDTYYATLASDGTDATIAELLNRDPASAPQVVREAMYLFAAVQRGEVPPQLVQQWRQWMREELARGVADVVIRELTNRNLAVAGQVVPQKADEERAAPDRFAESASVEEL